ncbi:substrate-binding domain-containing protein [Anaerotignum sp.]|uniref:substrate-binding domain-containing protein n=1 Tax=Anaerotignum sp. TaxID=2039241 RepID=UPI0028A83A04|nr:substrate-binding domain-containing protein [Anaerotignum sp.]
MKKKLGLGLVMLMLTSALVGCGGSSDSADSSADANAGANTAAISVVSREDGSGTRGAFIELFGIEEKDADGNKVDYTADTAEITNSTAVMMQTIAGNKDAIGYISLGSLNDTVKALEIDGAAATVDNIKNDTYKISRPFNIATKDEVTPAAQDFINFIMSAEGQAVVEKSGYISEGNAGAYAASDAEGKVTVAGSSSVAPVMEKLKEAYAEVNPNITIEVQQSDSTTGMTSTIEGICDIGMASRALKDSELEKGLTPTVIAMDGIAVIVNIDNPVNGLATAQVKDIFTGVATDWSIAE